MFKNIQFKIILIFFLIGIIIISGLGISFLNSIQLLNLKVENGQVSSVQVEEILNIIQQRTSITLIVAGIIFAIIGIIAAIALSKFVIYPIKLTKVLFSKEILNSEDEYLGYLSLGYKVIWDEYKIYFPLEQGDQTAIMENERVSKIKFGNLSAQYRESLMFMAEELLENVSANHIRKIIKNIE